MGYPTVDETERSAYSDYFGTRTQKSKNYRRREAQGQELGGVCAVGTHSAHLRDVMMRCVCPPEKGVMVRPPMNPIIDELRSRLNNYCAENESGNRGCFESNRNEGIFPDPFKRFRDGRLVVV